MRDSSNPPPVAPAGEADAAGTAGDDADDGSAFDFATGAAVTVAADYAPPEDRVPSTGAYLPVNGQPTVVFVDAIW